MTIARLTALAAVLRAAAPRRARAGLLGCCVALGAAGGASDATGQPHQQLVPRAVVKLIIDHAALAAHLRPEVAGRVPLVISDHLLSPGVTPSKFGQPVRILDDRAVGGRPHIRFKSFAVDGARARCVIEYQVEGVEAAFDLMRTDSGWWSVVDARVTTR